MAIITFNEAKRAIGEKEIDLVADDIRVMLIMSNTTAATDYDVNTISAIGTLDELVAAGRKVLAGKGVTEVTGASGKAQFTATNPVWTALANGARQVVAALVYLHVTTDADSVPIAYMDGADFPFDGGGLDTTLAFAGGVFIESL